MVGTFYTSITLRFHNKQNHFRDSSGKIVVKISFKDSTSHLGGTREMTTQRCCYLEYRYAEQSYENEDIYSCIL